jgi:hypothetical protein
MHGPQQRFAFSTTQFFIARTLLVGLAVAVLGGCSSGAGSQVAPLGPMLQSAAPAAGGSFSASYSGTYSLSFICGQNPQGYFKVSGTGSASFLHRSTEAGSMYVKDRCGYWLGTGTLTSSHNPRNTITVWLRSVAIGSESPCYNPRGVQFSVTGGTGKFAHATGSGTVRFVCNNNGTYTDHWTGTVMY